MKNNVYIRSNRSIFTISITRIGLLLPLIIYGFYKNGIYLYQHGYTNIIGMFKPLVLVFGSIIIGILINLVYEYIIKKNKTDLISTIFSSFHVEYSIILACLMPISINLLVYFSVISVLLFISKFLNNRVNIMCICFIVIYILSTIFFDFNYANSYELDKKFSLDFMDYLIGKGIGGFATTHIILLIIAFFGLHFTNNSKTAITLSSVITLIIFFAVYAIVKDTSFLPLIFNNNLLFAFTYVVTDSVTSCYTLNGKIVFGIISALLTGIIYIFNPILAPFIAILIVSLFNNLLDRKVNAIIKNLQSIDRKKSI